MKKTYRLFLLLTVITISTISCNKTYQCECKSGGRVVSVIPIKTLGKGGAKNVCDGYQIQNNAQGANQVCDIK
jgi:hypothetical protein